MTPYWDAVSYVISSRYRKLALNRLDKGPATPSQIATGADVGIVHVPRALQELSERGRTQRQTDAASRYHPQYVAYRGRRHNN